MTITGDKIMDRIVEVAKTCDGKETDLTENKKATIDEMTYDRLWIGWCQLEVWPMDWFHGTTGQYWRARMKQLRPKGVTKEYWPGHGEA